MRIFNKMKKTMLVMAASLFCVGAAFAEVKTGSYAVAADDIASGAQITSVEGITLTYGVSEDWTSGSGKATVGDLEFPVYASCSSTNPSPNTGKVPEKGAYVVLTPQYAGTVTAVVSNSGNNKSGYIVKDADNNLVNGTVTIDGAEVAWESGTPFNSADKYSGGVTFEVEAGASYYVYISGSKMRFNGFIYSYEEVEEAPVVEGTPLASDMFKAWDGVGADAQSTGAVTSDTHIGEEVGAGAMIFGASTVDPLAYADLSAYEKMIIVGTPGVQLRVLMNRALGGEAPNFNGALTEVNVTIGEDGKAEVDLSSYDFVHLNAIKTGWGSANGTINSITLVEGESSEEPEEPQEPEVPAVDGTPLTADIFKAWDGVGADAQATGAATAELHVGENLGAGAMVYGTSTVYYLNYADLTGYEKIVFVGTPGMQLRVLMNRVENEGALVEVNPTIGEDGKAEVDLTGYEYVHLNAIKTGWGSAAGTINSITLVKAPATPAAKVAYLCGATETTEAIFTALVNVGLDVTPLNYDDVTLTDEIIANDFVGKYDLVVLAGASASSTNLSKSANLLLGKVNVLSTKSFWYKHYGTNGTNPGTADNPSLNLVKLVANHPIFEGIAGDEFAAFIEHADERTSGRYLQGNGSFANGPEQVALATANGADCIGEAWVDGKGYVIIPVDGAQPAGYLTADGEALFANVAKYLIAGEQFSASRFDLTAYEAAVAAAEAFKATLAADTYFEKEIIEELIVAIDEATAYAKEGVDMAASQEDVDISTNMLNETVLMYKNNYDGQVIGFKMEEVRQAGQEVLAKYPEETRVDNAGLVEALMNLPMRTMGYTVEQLQAAVAAVEAAIPVFEKENNQAILDAAKKKANDYAATLDASEETGTMVQMEAYNGLTYYTSDDFFAESGITADSYDMVMSYSQQIDMMIAQYDPMIQKEKSMMAATKAAAEAQETMASYDNATDEAGLAAAIAKVNTILGELGMWDTEYTIADLNKAVEELAAARVAFEKENGLDTGTYWLKNVASGKFITAGESWGTCAVFGDHGMDFDFALQEDGTFIIDSKLSNGGESHYFGAEGWMDAAATKWNIEKLPNGAYTITADGTNYLGYDESNVWNAQTKVTVNMTDNATEAAQWIIMNKAQMVASLEGASLENPGDATFFISCPNFGRNDTRFDAVWKGGPVRNGNNDNMAAEKWNTNFDVYQDLAGLPNGYYKLTAQGYYRAGNGGATGMERNAYLYAGAKKTPLVNINTEAGNAIFEGGNVSDVAGMGIVPNNMQTATTGFTAGLYADNSVIVAVTDGTLRIGVKKETLIDADWTMFDNFELTYYGNDVPAVVADGTYYMKNVAAGKFLNGGNSWGTQASLVDNGFDATLTYSNGTYTIDTNVPNGSSRHFLGSNGYVDSDVANWKIVPAGENFAITLDGVNFIGYDSATSVMALNLTDATKAEAQWQFITKEEMIAALDGATEANPGNATFFIVGQNFNRGDANRNAAWQGSPAVGGINENHAGEKFNTNFDVYQELTGLPTGYYELSAQAYYRAGGNDVLVANKDAKNAVLYAGINSVPVMGILDEVGKEGMPNDVNIEGYGQVPNGMSTAAQAFTAGLYTNNKVLALVTDGTLRVGVKKDVTIANDWTMFDNFQLAYLGTGIPSVFADAVDSLNAAIADANAWKATLDATNEMDAQVIALIEQGMVPAAQAVAAQPASITQIEQMIADVNMFVAQTNMSLGQMKAAEAQALFEGFENPSDDAGFEASFNEVFEIANGLVTGAYTWADLNAALASMRVAQKAFIYENPKAPTATISAIQGANRVVALAHELEGLTIYYKTSEAADYMIYTAPFHVSTATTVWAYAEYVSPEAKAYASDVANYTIAAEIVKLNAPIVEVEGIAAETEENLTTAIFMTWDGVGADAQPTGEAVYPEIHVGEELGAGAMVYGLSTVYYLSYADLTGYSKIVFEGTPGVQLRVLMNRVENEGALVEVNPTIGEDGKAEVDLTGYEYVHLNAIKTGWGSAAGTITKVALVAEGEPVAFNCVVTSDQSEIINNYGITPKETITYDFFPWNEDKGECAKVPSISGIVTSGESINGLSAGLLIVKVAAYGFESATTVKYLGAAEDWAGGDAFVTGIDEVNAKEVKAVKFYTVSGVEIEEPTTGLYIKRVLYSDGTVKTSTIMGK